MSVELCCNCGQPTERAGRHEDSLYAGIFGPYCEDCWVDAPMHLADHITELEAQLATARNDALEEAAKIIGGRIRKICSEAPYDSTTNHVELSEGEEVEVEALEWANDAIRALKTGDSEDTNISTGD